MRVTDVIEGVRYERDEVPGCPLCGRRHPPREIAAHFGMRALVAECADCRIAYQSPRPGLDASLAYMDMRWRSTDAYVADAERQRARSEDRLAYVAPLTAPPGRLLDFGAGVGMFAAVAGEHGWEVTGVERSAQAVARAREELGVELVPELAGARGDFDVVTLWDVVEHLRDPVGVVRELAGRLRPGGWVLLETGNWESWARLAMGDAWGLYLFDHQYYFSPASLETVLRSAGLGEVELLGHPPRRPPAEPPEGATRPAADRWAAYRRGTEAWPAHAGIDLMVVAARRPWPGPGATDGRRGHRPT